MARRPEGRQRLEVAAAAALVALAGALHAAGAGSVLEFAVSATAIAVLARLVGTATEALGNLVGPGSAGVVQSALGNLPELFIALFALHRGLPGVVQAALVGSMLANGLLVLGIAFTAGGIVNGTQRFDSPRARMIATLSLLGAGILSFPTLAHTLHSPAAPHARTLSFICAGVLIVLFVATLPGFLSPSEESATDNREGPQSTARTLLLLVGAGVAAAVVSDWFVAALEPATRALHMSPTFAGLVVVAIVGNAVENVVGVQLAVHNRPDFAISVIVNSTLQVALFLTPVLVLASLAFATPLTLVFPPLLAASLLLGAGVAALVVYDGESTWAEGLMLVGLYVVIATGFWWGALTAAVSAGAAARSERAGGRASPPAPRRCPRARRAGR